VRPAILRALLGLALLTACDSGTGGVAPSAALVCPPSECRVSDLPAEKEGRGAPLAPATDVGALVASANRKLMRDDGAGCLEDLDEVRKSDPKMDARLAGTRGQCEMLVGRCRAGKQRIAHWYEVEIAMTPERAAAAAEQLGAMRCREGDSTDRDALLRAHFELSIGGYEKHSPEWCGQRVTRIRELLPKVAPKDAMDGQIRSAGHGLFHTAAACYAHAGDCEGAYVAYRDLFPAAALAAIEDAEAREEMVSDSFERFFAQCKP